MREMLRRFLSSQGWKVTTARDGLSALQVLEQRCFDAVLADSGLPGPPGVRVLEHARVVCPSSTLVLFSGWLTQEARERAQAIGAACLTKGSTDSLALLLTILDGP